MTADTRCAHDHGVGFYESETALVESVAAFAGPVLRAGESFVLVATPEHRRRVATALTRAGVDVAGAEVQGRYLVADAATLLRSFMVDGGPDGERFAAAAKPLLDAAARSGGRVHVFGEMVALLYAHGDVTAAIELEDLWNDLAGERDFRLLCAYPLAFFEDETGDEAFRRICEQHSSVFPAEGYPVSGVADEQQRAVARMQRENAALRAEAARLRSEQHVLAELAYADGLTGLANRRAFDIHLQREWALAQREGADSYVLIADLDGFKGYNDEHGHVAGDEVLREFGEVLREAGRCTDVIARLGGDEFAILLVRCQSHAPAVYAARLRELMGQPAYAGLNGLTASLGRASLLDAVSPAQALHRADLRMFQDKRGVSR